MSNERNPTLIRGRMIVQKTFFYVVASKAFRIRHVRTNLTEDLSAHNLKVGVTTTIPRLLEPLYKNFEMCWTKPFHIRVAAGTLYNIFV